MANVNRTKVITGKNTRLPRMRNGALRKDSKMELM